MKEALLYKKLPDKSVQCNTCERRCVIAPDQMGFCNTRVNKGGKLYSLIYEVISSLNIDPIEKKPLFHFLPGSQVFSIGTWGCNFKCLHCQNWEISYAKPQAWQYNSRVLTPAEAVNLAVKYNADGIAWTYNEPSIWFEYTLDCAKIAKKKGLYTVYVTNGYITKEALDKIGPYLDVFRTDIKGFSDEFYRKIARVPDFRHILEISKYAKNKYGMHVEYITNVIPGYNDDEKQLASIAKWIKENLGEKTPWHVTRFYPCAELTNVPSTPIDILERAKKIGEKEGLKFVYIGNVPGHPGENTICPKCKKEVINREGYATNIIGVDKKGHCAFCGEDLNIIMSKDQLRDVKKRASGEKIVSSRKTAKKTVKKTTKRIKRNK